MIGTTYGRPPPVQSSRRWDMVDLRPYEHMHEYWELIASEEVAVLVVDELLSEEITKPVSYTGHELARYLRTRFPEFPIFTVTTYPTTPGLQANDKDLDGI